MADRQFRTGVLSSFGAGEPEIDELIAYNQNAFDHSKLKYEMKFPLPDEPFVSAWENYADESGKKGVFEVLKSKLVQLRFPIQDGISKTENYCSAARRGVSADDMAEAAGLTLRQPGKLKLIIHQSIAGKIPLLITGDRNDFVSLVRALTMKNEPGLVPASMGAAMVAGFNNWDRIREYRKKWEDENPSCSSEEKWKEEFLRLIPQKELYQDKFIILSDGPYSAVPAADMGLTAEEWQNISLSIRREHECAHYFTRRMFSSMRNNLIDELIADYTGIAESNGHYRSDWFLRFVGLESFPDYRDGGRLQNYRGDPPLTDGAFKILQVLVKNASENLERFDAGHSEELRSGKGKALMLMGLTYLTLEELASKDAPLLIQNVLIELRK